MTYGGYVCPACVEWVDDNPHPCPATTLSGGDLAGSLVVDHASHPRHPALCLYAADFEAGYLAGHALVVAASRDEAAELLRAELVRRHLGRIGTLREVPLDRPGVTVL